MAGLILRMFVFYTSHRGFGVLGSVFAVPAGFVGCFYCHGLAAKSLCTQPLCFALTVLQTSTERLIPEPSDPTLVTALINPWNRQDVPLELLPPWPLKDCLPEDGAISLRLLVESL